MVLKVFHVCCWFVCLSLCVWVFVCVCVSKKKLMTECSSLQTAGLYTSRDGEKAREGRLLAAVSVFGCHISLRWLSTGTQHFYRDEELTDISLSLSLSSSVCLSMCMSVCLFYLFWCFVSFYIFRYALHFLVQSGITYGIMILAGVEHIHKWALQKKDPASAFCSPPVISVHKCATEFRILSWKWCDVVKSEQLLQIVTWVNTLV